MVTVPYADDGGKSKASYENPERWQTVETGTNPEGGV
jgi:hypothetical protein